MCTILLAWHTDNQTDFVLAANRDELVARPGEPPQLLSSNPPIVGGRDSAAGGTWLAVAPGPRVCAVTNRRVGLDTEVTRDASRTSRGEIPLEVLHRHEDGIPEFLAQMEQGRYNPVNVLYVSPSLAVAASIDDTPRPRVTLLSPGLHVLTVGDIDDGTRDKDAVLYQYALSTMKMTRGANELERKLRVALSRHSSVSGDPLDAACIHGDVYGTVSSATIVAEDGGFDYRHAQGRPCDTPFARVDLLDQVA